MDEFDLNIDSYGKRRTERQVRRHDVPDPTPSPAFDESEPKIETIEDKPRRTRTTRTAKQQIKDQPIAEASSKEGRTKKRPIQKRPNVFIAPFLDRRLHLFLGITGLVIGVVMMIALVSYLHTAADDQNLVLNQTVAEMAQNPSEVHNAGGAFGAWLSHVTFSDSLGLGAFVLAIYIITISGCLIIRKKINFWAVTCRALLLTATVSVIAGLVTYEADSAVYWGGIHGAWLNKYLIDSAGAVGALAVSIILIAADIAVFYHPICVTGKCLKAWMPKLPKAMPKYDEGSPRPVVNPSPVVESKATVESISTTEQEATSEQEPVSEPEPVAGHDTAVEPVPLADDAHSLKLKNTHPEVVFTIDNCDDLADEEKQPASKTPITAEPTFTVTLAEEEPVAVTPTSSVTGPKPMGDGALDPHDRMHFYQMPAVDLLTDYPVKHTVDNEEQQQNKDRIVKVLGDYKISVAHISATVGPTVTLFELVPTEGTRISQIKRLEDDIAMALKAKGIRIIAPIPGKGTVGIEVPNSEPQTVSMRSVLSSPKFVNSDKALPVALGKTITNEVFVADLAKMPHALVAGATGQGKSVGLNAIIASLLYKKHPTELKFVLIDPKMVEFSLYAKIEKHYLAKLPGEDEAIITDSAKVLSVLNSLCVEMDNRYALLKKAAVRDVSDYNRKFCQGRLSTEDGHDYMPYIVVIIDEFADLIMIGGKEIENPVIRITQKARAVGIHMIIATQRPSTNVLTGLIKANCPARVAFRVQQMVDSRCILDRPGANQLIGRGDMLYSSAGGALERMQCAFISTEEVEQLVDFIDAQPGVDTYILPDPAGVGPMPDYSGGGMLEHAGANLGGADPLLRDCAEFLASQWPATKPSVSSLQRRFSIGYNRAGKIIDSLEAAGIVSAPQGNTGVRAMLVEAADLQTIFQSLG